MISSVHGRFYRRYGKRAIDITGAGVGLLLLSPLLLAVAVAVRMRIGHPVLFRQRRPGFLAQPFLLIKFRTMTNATDREGRPLPDAQRLTPLGKGLRACSLDEVPELWNVLRGDMSLVGPRPLLMEYLPLYNERQMRRHEMKPGITGWAQVNGRNSLQWEEKFELDLWYIENCSFVLDLKILARTLIKVFTREGISHGEEATMPWFTGSRS